ncbi:MAG: hypothetical protein ACOCPV_02140, partial [Halodesulfurarchaeum sp.]
MTEERVVREAGVTVSKSFDAEGFPVPAVTLAVDSERSEPVSLRITETVPDRFTIDQIGFHPDYGSDHWTARSDGTLRFEREVDPGASFTTVYGIRMEDGTDPEPLLTEPTVEVEPASAHPSDGDTGSPTADESVGPSDGGRDSVIVGESTVAGSNKSTGTGDEETTSEKSEPSYPDDDAEIIGGSLPERESTDESAPSTNTDQDADSERGTAEATGPPADEPTEQSPAGASRTSEDLYSTSTSETSADERAATAESSAESPSTDEDMSQANPDSTPGTDDSTVGTDDAPEREEVGTPTTDSTAETESADQNETDAAVDSVARSDGSDGTPLVSQLREELESGAVTAAEREALAEALRQDESGEAEPGGRSLAVRFDHLQSRVAELEAYTDALEDFIEMAGTSDDIREVIDSEVADLETTVETLETKTEALDSGQASLESSVKGVEERLAELGADVQELD